MNSKTPFYPDQRLILSEEEQIHRVMAGAFLQYENAKNRVQFLENEDIAAFIK